MEYAGILQAQVYPNNESPQVLSRSELEDLKNELKLLRDKVEAHEQKLLKYEQNTINQNKLFKKFGSKYYYIEDQHRMNWFAAAYRCQNLGGHLVSLQSDEDFNVLVAQLKKPKSYWIDINDLTHEGEFLSHTTGRLAEYLNWYPNGSPDNARGNENCGQLWNIDGRYGMNDETCTNLFYFVCEKEMQ